MGVDSLIGLCAVVLLVQSTCNNRVGELVGTYVNETCKREHGLVESEVVITIDGPAGAGKSTVAKSLANLFGYEFLDTGALYRAVTLAALRGKIDWNDSQSLARVAESLQLEFKEGRVLINGEDVSELIRTPEIAAHIGYISKNHEIRDVLGNLQQRIARGKRIVTEGRDQGTEIFPKAAFKFFLTAKPETRARRRYLELIEKGTAISYDEVLSTQRKRDYDDEHREKGALRPAADAVIVMTDDLSHDDVVAQLANLVTEKMQCNEDSIRCEQK